MKPIAGKPALGKVIGAPSWHFRLSKKGFRTLWSNFPLPFAVEFAPDNRMMKVKRQYHGKPIVRHSQIKSLRGPERAEIPYPIARFVADTVKGVMRI